MQGPTRVSREGANPGAAGQTLGGLRASGVAGEARAAQLWTGLVATNRYVIDGLTMARMEPLDLLDILLLIALIQANVTPVTTDRDLQLRYAVDAPPDEVRRAISVTALSGSLGLPFETVRRRLGRLNELGYCELAERGYRVPTHHLNTPDYVSRIAGGWELVRSLYVMLRGAGCLEGLAVSPAEPSDSEPLRVMARAAGDFALRVFTVMAAQIGDPVDIFVVMALMHLNTGGDPGVRPGGTLAPVRIARLSEQLNLPYETARRRLRELGERGLCVRGPRGWVVPAEQLALLRVDTLEENLANLRRLFATLARFGILAAWDSTLDAGA